MSLFSVFHLECAQWGSGNVGSVNVLVYVPVLVAFLVPFFSCVLSMKYPLRTAFAVSQRIDGEISGESLSSIKDVHSLERKLLQSLFARSEAEVLNCRLLEGVGAVSCTRLKLTGSWSEIIIG